MPGCLARFFADFPPPDRAMFAARQCREHNLKPAGLPSHDAPRAAAPLPASLMISIHPPDLQPAAAALVNKAIHLRADG